MRGLPASLHPSTGPTAVAKLPSTGGRAWAFLVLHRFGLLGWFGDVPLFANLATAVGAASPAGLPTPCRGAYRVSVPRYCVFHNLEAEKQREKGPNGQDGCGQACECGPLSLRWTVPLVPRFRTCDVWNEPSAVYRLGMRRPGIAASERPWPLHPCLCLRIR